jgi:gas vesicle protein
MFSRKSKLKRRAQAVADKAAEGGGVRGQLDELGAALDDAREAIARASASAGRKVADVTAEAAKQAAEATREAARQAGESTRRASRRQAKAARATAERLGESELPKKAADRLFRDRAKARRQERRRQQRRTVYRGAGIAGLGVLVGWLTAPRRGQEARQALKQQAAKASEKGWEKVAEGRSGGQEQQGAEVHPLHDATGTTTQPRPPND